MTEREIDYEAIFRNQGLKDNEPAEVAIFNTTFNSALTLMSEIKSLEKAGKKITQPRTKMDHIADALSKIQNFDKDGALGDLLDKDEYKDKLDNLRFEFENRKIKYWKRETPYVGYESLSDTRKTELMLEKEIPDIKQGDKVSEVEGWHVLANLILVAQGDILRLEIEVFGKDERRDILIEGAEKLLLIAKKNRKEYEKLGNWGMIESNINNLELRLKKIKEKGV